MDKGARTGLYLSQLTAERFPTHDKAFDGFNHIFNKGEDENSPDDYDPEGRSPDRIYGPSKLFSRLTEFEGLIKYDHKSHVSYINQNGAIRVETRRGEVLLDIPGVDGQFCPKR